MKTLKKDFLDEFNLNSKMILILLVKINLILSKIQNDTISSKKQDLLNLKYPEY
jgi:hypothetical protein